jgi:hypothetical protein
MIPWLAIGGFAGLRTAKIQRLDWSEINLVERHIEIKSLSDLGRKKYTSN